MEGKENRAPDLKYLERESLKKGDSDTGTAADVELVMKKYDRESNTRVWQGKLASIIRWLSVLFSVYSIYVTLFSTALPEIRLSMFLGMILILGYLHYPVQKGDRRINYMPWYDWVLMAVGAVPFFYFAANSHAIIKLGDAGHEESGYGADGDSGGALADGTLQALCGNPDSLCGRCTACIYICDGAFWKGYL